MKEALNSSALNYGLSTHIRDGAGSGNIRTVNLNLVCMSIVLNTGLHHNQCPVRGAPCLFMKADMMLYDRTN